MSGKEVYMSEAMFGGRTKNQGDWSRCRKKAGDRMLEQRAQKAILSFKKVKAIINRRNGNHEDIDMEDIINEGIGCVIKASALTHKGYVRQNNEDNILFSNYILNKNHTFDRAMLLEGEFSKNPVELFGVFDGMGGYENGEEASWIAAGKARDFLYEWRETENTSVDSQALKDICLQANETVCRRMDEEGITMGTTASMLCFDKEKLCVCNIGDTPIFRMRDGVLEPIFKEHSQRVYYEQMMGFEAVEGKHFPLTQCIGIRPSELKISPYLKELDWKVGDRYLICSDGLTDMVFRKEIAAYMNAEKDINVLGETLLEAALKNGGKDNITIILLELQEM